MRVRWIVTAGAVLIALAVGQRMLSPAEVTTVGLERRDIVETLAVVGRVRAPSRAALGSSAAGTVTSVSVREGDRVVRGKVLVALDDREAVASVREAEAALAEISANAKQDLANAEREAIQSSRDAARIRAVVEVGGLNQQQLEQAEQRAADAASRLEALRAGATLDGTGEPASVARARATLEAARARLALTRITSPAAGVILTRTVEPGDAISPGRILVEMAFDGPAELVVFPAEENLARLMPGAIASASADAFPDQTFPASVSLIAPVVDASQGTVEVRLAIADPPAYLVPEMTVSVNIETGRKEDATVLREDAVQGLGTSQPWVAAVRDGRLAREDVTVGLRAAGYVEIVTGVAEDDEVALAVTMEDVGRRVRVSPRPEGE